MPSTALSRVVFPEPLGPSRNQNSPAQTSSATSRSTLRPA
jgi:hypothetical protein